MTLTETSPELLEALRAELPKLADGIDVYNTGGGCMVAEILLPTRLDADLQRRSGRVWLTRDTETEWLVGFYDDGLEDGDEGVCLVLHSFIGGPSQTNVADDPNWVASSVAGVLRRVGQSA